MKKFEYSAPTTVSQAVELLAGGGQVVAGGTDLIVQMRERRRTVKHIVDLKRIPELNEIGQEPDGSLRIGAALNVTAMTAAPGLAAYPALTEASRMIGSYQIQNRASLGGNICNASPSADAVPALICVGARAVIAGPSGRRHAAIESLFLGPGKTTLGVGELLVAVALPPVVAGAAAKYIRFTPRHEMDIAVAGVGAWIQLDSNGVIAAARVALSSVAPTPVRSLAAEQLLCGERAAGALFVEAGRLAAADASPISDTRGSSQYRKELVRVLCRRALASCCAQLGRLVEVE